MGKQDLQSSNLSTFVDINAIHIAFISCTLKFILLQLIALVPVFFLAHYCFALMTSIVLSLANVSHTFISPVFFLSHKAAL